MQSKTAPSQPAGNSGAAPTELRLEGVSKSYGGVRALQEINTTFRSGLTGIIGDNGAGKSTMMKILSGVTRPDTGTITLGEKALHLTSPVDARLSGIESLYQDLALADTLDITSNIFLGREMTRSFAGLRVLQDRAMAKAARETLSQVNIRIPDVAVPVRALSGGQRQAVALARAVRFNAPVVLLDEPTAALGPRETAAVNDIIGRLVDSGRMVIIVTHDIPAIVGMADHLIVMRAGRIVREVDPRQTNQEELLAYMVGSRT
ncbi:ATP-binding cassette domain-containing protein [Sinomonas susongensis]|uniref:ATP-binding cassette domain-containing protein n=1 Tax=Sinomonas susongensis TaxID=1324851 RepID=UPI0011099A20|nr:ATP-binding cassette domain-containing protein [Sinomonas susongensis]